MLTIDLTGATPLPRPAPVPRDEALTVPPPRREGPVRWQRCHLLALLALVLVALSGCTASHETGWIWSLEGGTPSDPMLACAYAGEPSPIPTDADHWIHVEVRYEVDGELVGTPVSWRFGAEDEEACMVGLDESASGDWPDEPGTFVIFSERALRTDATVVDHAGTVQLEWP